MSMHEPLPHEPPRQPPQNLPVIVDSGVEVREADRASAAQVGMTIVAIAAILGVFFYGLNSQRPEVASSGSTPVASSDTGGAPSAPQGNAPETTGRASSDQTAPAAKPAGQPPANAGQNGTPAHNNAAPAPPRGAGQ